MRADYASFRWDFSADITDDSVIKCPECLDFSPLSDWDEGEVGCEDCGSHTAIVCPKCDEYFDHIHGPTFEVKAVDHA